MIKIHLGNVYSKIDKKAASREELTAVHQLLSIKIPGYYFSRKYKMGQWDGTRKFFNLLLGTFYTGLLGVVLAKLVELNIPYELIDDRTQIPSKENILSLRGITLRDYQIRMIREALEHRRGIIAAPPNSGKTEIACGIIQVLGLPANFFTHRLSLLFQTKDRFERRLGVPIGVMGGGEEDLQDINILSIQTVSKRMDDPKILALLKNTPVAISDEVHHISSKTWETILQKSGAFYRYGLSATALLRDDVSNMVVRGLTGGEIATVTNQELIGWGISAEPSVYLINITDPKVRKHETFDVHYENGIVFNPLRNSHIVASARRFLGMGKSVFILVFRIAHGQLLVNMLQEAGVAADFISGEDDPSIVREKLNEFSERRLKCLVSSTISDEGLDVPSMDVLILGVGHKSAVKTIQRVGRGLRKKKEGLNVVDIVDFIDRGSQYLYRHSVARARIYVKMAIPIYEVVDGDWNRVEKAI